MNLIEFINYILNSFLGADFVILDLVSLTMIFDSMTGWYQLFNPHILLSVIFYLSVFCGIWSIVFVLPYRVFKKIIKYPSKKGCEYN